MALTFSPKHSTQFFIEHLTTGQILALCLEVAAGMNWTTDKIHSNGFIAYSRFSFTSWGEEIHIRVEENLVTVSSRCYGNQLFDWGKNKKNTRAFEEMIVEYQNSYSAAELDYKYQEVSEQVAQGTSEEEEPGFFADKGRFKGIRSVFFPREGYFITPVLILINVLVFTVMCFSGVSILVPESEELIRWGANMRPYVLQGEVWRLFTCMFLHIGVFHLLLNMYALSYIGMIVEPLLGKARFTAAYLLAGLAGSVNSIWWHSLTVSAGASGAIFGLYGLFIALLLTNHVGKAARKTVLRSTMIFVGFNLISGTKQGIDNAAHIGGLLAGLLIGLALYPSLKKAEAVFFKYASLTAISCMVIFICFFAGVRIKGEPPVSSDGYQIAEYQAKFESFVSMERMALEVMQMPKETPRHQLLRALEDRGIYYWKECLQVVNEADALSLPTELHDRNKQLKEYCELRIKSFELLYIMVRDGEERPRPAFKTYNQRIEAIISRLGKEQR